MLETEFIEKAEQMSSDEKYKIHEKMKKLHDKIISYSDGKREIALQTYNMVDKHIRRLDTEIAKYNDFSPEKSTANKRKNDVQAEIIKGKKKRLKTNKNGSENKNVKIKNEFDDEDSNKSGRKKTLSQSIEGSEVVHETDTKNNVQLLALGSELDMEVDPSKFINGLLSLFKIGEFQNFVFILALLSHKIVFYSFRRAFVLYLSSSFIWRNGWMRRFRLRKYRI